MAVGPQESVLAPRFSRVMGVLVVAICVLTEVALVQYGRMDLLLRATPALAFVIVGTYTLFWAPLVRINSSEIEIVNPLRTHRIAWPAIRDITTRWTLTVVTDRGSYSAWAAPAQSPWASVGRFNRDALGRPSLSPEAATQRLGSRSGVTSIVLQQWESYRDTAHDGAVDVSTRWHLATAIALATLAALTLVGLIWP